jgi:hypothetical protein
MMRNWFFFLSFVFVVVFELAAGRRPQKCSAGKGKVMIDERPTGVCRGMMGIILQGLLILCT